MNLEGLVAPGLCMHVADAGDFLALLYPDCAPGRAVRPGTQPGLHADFDAGALALGGLSALNRSGPGPLRELAVAAENLAGLLDEGSPYRCSPAAATGAVKT